MGKGDFRLALIIGVGALVSFAILGWLLAFSAMGWLRTWFRLRPEAEEVVCIVSAGVMGVLGGAAGFWRQYHYGYPTERPPTKPSADPPAP